MSDKPTWVGLFGSAPDFGKHFRAYIDDRGNDVKVAYLRDWTGLTAAQVGRLFGVSRRTVNNWLSGRPMANHHEERLAEIMFELGHIRGESAQLRRLALFDSSKGKSAYHRLIDSAPKSAVLQRYHTPQSIYSQCANLRSTPTAAAAARGDGEQA